jgi:Na+-translocating ferredoxin:NAD+ oxidoreductase RnfG subunit
MKKAIAILILSVVTAFFTACGPSETERKVEEEKTKHEADSIKESIKEDIASEMDSLKKDNKTSDSLMKEKK